MPRDRKKPTLAKQAHVAACKKYGTVDKYIGARIPFALGYLAGHRANRLTKAEREVVEAAKAFVRREPNSAPKLDAAVSNLERAKGRKP
jgi:hypothetical protein